MVDELESKSPRTEYIHTVYIHTQQSISGQPEVNLSLTRRVLRIEYIHTYTVIQFISGSPEVNPTSLWIDDIHTSSLYRIHPRLARGVRGFNIYIHEQSYSIYMRDRMGHGGLRTAHSRIYIYIYIYMCVCVCVFMCVCIYIYIYVCVCVCVCIPEEGRVATTLQQMIGDQTPEWLTQIFYRVHPNLYTHVHVVIYRLCVSTGRFETLRNYSRLTRRCSVRSISARINYIHTYIVICHIYNMRVYGKL